LIIYSIQTCYKTAQLIATGDEQESQAPSALISYRIVSYSDSQYVCTVQHYETHYNLKCRLHYLWSQLPRRMAKQDFHWRLFHEMGWPPMNG